MNRETPLPDWLTVEDPNIKATPTQLELTRLQFELMFPIVIDKVSQGIPLSAILEKDVRDINKGDFMRWIIRSSSRKEQYYEAQAIGAEIISSEMISIADGEDNELEDIARSKLRIETRKHLIGIWDKKRFGETKQVEVGVISISTALADAQKRIQIPTYLNEGSTHSDHSKSHDEILDADYEEIT